MQALEKSKYEQSLETVRHFIAIAEKELELYHRHIALYITSTPSVVAQVRLAKAQEKQKKALAIDNTNDESLATEDDDDDDVGEDNGDDDHHNHMSLFLSVKQMTLVHVWKRVIQVNFGMGKVVLLQNTYVQNF